MGLWVASEVSKILQSSNCFGGVQGASDSLGGASGVCERAGRVQLILGSRRLASEEPRDFSRFPRVRRQAPAAASQLLEQNPIRAREHPPSREL